MKRIMLSFMIGIGYFSLLHGVAEAPEVDITKTLNEKANLEQSADKIGQQNDQLIEQQRDRDAIREQRTEATKELLTIDNNSNMTADAKKARKNELQTNITNFNNQLSAYSPTLDENIKTTQASLENTQKLVQQKKDILITVQNNPEQVAKTVADQRGAIVKAGGTQDVRQATIAIDAVEAVTDKKSFGVIVRDFFNRLGTSFLKSLRSSFETVKNNINGAVQQTKDAITLTGKDFDYINGKVTDLNKQIADYNDSINKLKQVEGYGGSYAEEADLMFNGESTSAQQLVDGLMKDKPTITYDQFQQSIDNANKNLLSIVQKLLSSDIDKINNLRDAGKLPNELTGALNRLADAWNSDNILDTLSAYEEFEKQGLVTFDVSQLKRRAQVLKSLSDISSAYSSIQDIQSNLNDALNKRTRLLNKVNNFNQRVNDLNTKRDHRDLMAQLIDATVSRRGFFESLPDFDQKVTGGGVLDYIKTADWKYKSNQIENLNHDLSRRDPKSDVDYLGNTPSEKIQIATDGLNDLQDADKALGKVLKDLYDNRVNDEIAQQFSQLTMEDKNTAYAKMQRSVTNDLSDHYVNKNDRAALKADFLANRGGVLDLRKYGFPGVVMIERPTSNILFNDSLLNDYINERAKQYILGHTYEVFGLSTNKALKYSNDDIRKAVDNKIKESDIIKDRAKEYPKGSPQALAFEKEGADLFKGARQLGFYIDTASGRKLYDALGRGNADEIKSMITVITPKDFDQLSDGTQKFRLYTGSLENLQKLLKEKIKAYKDVLGNLKPSSQYVPQ